MGVVRQFIFAIDSEGDLHNSYSWDSLAADKNSDDKGITCAIRPESRGPDANVMQGQAFIGGLNLGKMYRTFRHDLAQDDSNTIRAESILNNINCMEAAERPAETLEFWQLEFPRINPVEKGLELYHAVDVQDPHKGGISWTALDTTDDLSDIAQVPNGIGKSLSLRIIDDTNVVNEAVFDGFVCHFQRLGTRF